MGHGLKVEASALVLCGGLAMVLASACDLTYTCDTVEPGGAGDEYPTGSVGAGDYPSNGADDEPEDEEVGSAQLGMAGGCSPINKCTEMYEACVAKGHPCNRYVNAGYTLCSICQDNCWQENDYKFRECYRCGFR
ncbi:hypothetical protein [Sorangium cellulosum]|uniref:hypothetical protein n=1 Tax=Sorangium cellulosum TaxID=56 RepID=UPI0011DE2A65|nr:hypothetical protein [Sorangium cellulosum]